MKRAVLCAVILASIIIFSCCSLFMLYRCNEKLYKHIDDCILSYYSDSDDISEKLEELESYWGSYYVRVSFLTRSSSLDDISYSIAKLEPLLDEQGDGFISELNSIRFWAYLIYQSQIPHLRSVF